MGHREAHERLRLLSRQSVRIEQRPGYDVSFHKKIGLFAVALLDGREEIVEEFGGMR